MNYNFNERLVKDIIDYLGNRPWVEVQHLINEMIQEINQQNQSLSGSEPESTKDVTKPASKK